jgi:hypothetical protein
MKEHTAKEWRQALQGLTPGGSEFLTPEECAAYVRKRTAYPRMIIEMRHERKYLIEAVEAALVACDYMLGDCGPEDREHFEPLRDKLQGALALTRGDVGGYSVVPSLGTRRREEDRASRLSGLCPKEAKGQ